MEVLDLVKQSGIRHLAYSITFDELFNGLEKEIEDGFVNFQTHPEFPHLKIYKYSHSCTKEKHWNIYTIVARGLILDTLNKKIVATPFIKFWNYDEIIPAKDVFEKDFTSLEKVDGSLCILFFAENEWRTATCGSFASEQAVWAKKYLYSNIDISFLDVGTTYLAEIIYPENRIVVPYKEENLYLLSAYRDGFELDFGETCFYAALCGFKTPKIYDFNSLDKIVETAKTLPYDDEGFVIRFNSGIRLKIKGDEYCRIHRLISKVTPLGIWEMLLNEDDLDEAKKLLPEEIQKDFNQIQSLLTDSLTQVTTSIEELYEKTKNLSDKELGLEIQNKDSLYFVEERYEKVKGFLFSRRKNDFFVKSAKKRIFESFRPKSNVLKGYTPSTASNRFKEEDF